MTQTPPQTAPRSVSARNLPLSERLIISLDVPSAAEAQKLVDQIGEAGVFYKIGYQLALNGGLGFARELISGGKKVFLDMKLLDIDNTVARAAENAVRLGVSMLSLHAYPKAMRAAAAAAKGSPLCLLAVTVLTSMDNADLAEAGYACTVEALALRRAGQAKQAGMGGLVASAAEAAAIRAAIGADMALVTPGIRMETQEKDDQKRVMTPRAALEAGASHLVIGRPIIGAPEPKAAVRAALAEMAEA